MRSINKSTKTWIFLWQNMKGKLWMQLTKEKSSREEGCYVKNWLGSNSNIAWVLCQYSTSKSFITVLTLWQHMAWGLNAPWKCTTDIIYLIITRTFLYYESMLKHVILFGYKTVSVKVVVLKKKEHTLSWNDVGLSCASSGYRSWCGCRCSSKISWSSSEERPPS